ncbi:MAG TPA: PAS domain S-box protein [Leptolyngbyaceae cyanobacterium]
MQKIETGANWYRHLYDHLPLICFTLDLTTVITDINLFGAYRLGYSIEELEKKPFSQLVHPNDFSDIQNILVNLRNQFDRSNSLCQVTCCKCRLICKDRSTILVEVNAKFVSENYANSCISIVCEDVDTELKEEKLDRLYETIFSNISEIVFLTDLNGRLTFICPNVEMVFGYSWREVQQMGNIEQLIGERIEDLRELEKENEIHIIEKEIIDKSGIKRCLQIQIKLIDFPEKALLYICQDITKTKQLDEKLRNKYSDWEKLVEKQNKELSEINYQLQQEIVHRQETEAALHKNQLRYRAIVESQTELICRFFPNGNLSFVNLAFCRYFGLSNKDLIGHNFLSFIALEDRQIVEQYIASLNINNPTGTLEYRVVLPNGETRWQQRNDRAIFNQQGHLLEFQSVGRDIQERKTAEEALNILSSAVEQTADNAIITDKFGIIKYVNSAFEKLTGYTKTEAIGKTPAILRSGEHPSIFYQELWLNILSGKVFRAEFINRKKNGELFYEEKTITPIKNHQGQITHFVSTGKDITDRVKAETALKESQAKYKALFEIFPIGISITDEAGNIIEVNQESEKILNINAENHLTKKCDEDSWQIVRKDGTKMPSSEFASTIALREKKLVKNVEMGILTLPDKIIWLNVNAVPIPLPGYGVAIAYTDITETKNSSVELEKSFSLLRATLECTDDGIIAFSADKKIIIFNQKIIEMWQIRNDIIDSGSNKRKLKFVFDRVINPQILINRIKECKNEPETKGYDILELKNGKIFEQYTQPQKIGDKIVGRVWSFRDITEQKRAEESLRQQAERERLLGRMAERIRRSLNLMEILNTTVAEVRQFLATDRVLIYRFHPDWSGVVVVESVEGDWTPILGTSIVDPCFGASMIQPYQEGRINGIEDIFNANIKECYFNLLTQFQVRANLVVPILQGEQLWGLLIAHHCRDARKWQDLEIDLLKQLATQVAIAIQQAELYQKLEKANQELQRLASLDGLTQLANRRRFDEYLAQEWERLLPDRAPLSLILCDVDCFKLYNDTYGHVAGDLCLQQVASAIRDVVRRPVDLVARYGGEEFAVILPNTTDVGAALIAKAILEKIRSLRLTHAASWVKEYVTLSLGVATTVPGWEFSPEQLIAIADNALYQAKTQGRDRFLLSQLS